MIDELGMLDILQTNGKLSRQSLLSYPNILVIQAAFQTLEKNGIVTCAGGFFRLTLFGESLIRHRGSIGLIYNGYRRIFSNQIGIAKNQPSQNWDLVDTLAVSRASTHFGENIIDEMVLKVLNTNLPRGAVCDLGCGEADRLIKICRMLGVNGFGFDISKPSLRKARKKLQTSDKIVLQFKDIMKIDKVYPEVEILFQAFVMHDLPETIFKKTICSLKSVFPKTKIFIYTDAVSPDEQNPFQLPGFDYVHSLLNIKTRTRKETIDLLKTSGFIIKTELSIPTLPNCYMWILVPE